MVFRQLREGVTGVTSETVTEGSKKRQLEEEVEEGWKYLRRLDEEQEDALMNRNLEEQDKLQEEVGVQEEMVDDKEFVVPEGILEEFVAKEGESEPKSQRNNMKFPNFTLMVLKNNVGVKCAADLATGETSLSSLLSSLHSISSLSSILGPL